jgi:large subunit ribosomal protein L15
MNNITLHSLPKITETKQKRLGRGHGSGKVKTSGRGTKGQKARGRIRFGYEGGQLELIKRLPLLRGKGKNIRYKKEVRPVNISDLNKLPAGSEVTVELLQKYNIISKKTTNVKILGKTPLDKKLRVMVNCSVSAQTVIEKAGGVVVPKA